MGDISPHLSEWEVECNCGCGLAVITNEFRDRYEVARVAYGFPIRFNSVCRCKDHNEDEGGVKNSAHCHGEAGDMHVTKGQKWNLVKCLMDAGFHGIGVYDTFVHADCSSIKPRPRIW